MLALSGGLLRFVRRGSKGKLTYLLLWLGLSGLLLAWLPDALVELAWWPFLAGLACAALCFLAWGAVAGAFSAAEGWRQKEKG